MNEDHEKTSERHSRTGWPKGGDADQPPVGDFEAGQAAAEEGAPVQAPAARLLHDDFPGIGADDPGADAPPEPQGLWERLIAYSNPVVSAELTDALQVFENDDMAAYDAIRSAIKLIAAVREALVVDPSDGTLRWRADTMTLILAADKLTGNLKIRSGTQDHDKVAKPGEHLHVRYDGGQVFVRIFSDIRRGP